MNPKYRLLLVIVTMLLCFQAVRSQRLADFGIVISSEATKIVFTKQKGYSSQPRLGFGADFWFKRSSRKHFSISIGMGFSRLQMQVGWDSIPGLSPASPPCNRFHCIHFEQRMTTNLIHTPVLFRFHFLEVKKGPYCGFGTDFGLFWGGNYREDDIAADGTELHIFEYSVNRRLNLSSTVFCGYQFSFGGRKALFLEAFAKGWIFEFPMHKQYLVTGGIRSGFWF